MRTIAFAALVLFAAGCASSTPPPVSALSAAPSLAVPTAPDNLRFTATTIDGKAFDASTLAGRPTVFWFWAAWCPTCAGDAAAVRDLQAATAGRVNVVGVAGLKSGSEGMRKFAADHRLESFPQLADDQGTVWKRFEVPAQNYYVILDASGSVTHRGQLTVDQLRKKVGA